MTQRFLRGHRVCTFSIFQPRLRNKLKHCVGAYEVQRRLRPFLCLLSQASLLVTTLSERFAEHASHVDPFYSNPKFYMRRSDRLDDMPNGFVWPGSIRRARWRMRQYLADQLIGNVLTILFRCQASELKAPRQQGILINLLIRLTWQ